MLAIVLASTGMVPDSEFFVKGQNGNALVIVLSSTGMVPVSEFEPRDRPLMPVRALSSAGMAPVRL